MRRAIEEEELRTGEMWQRARTFTHLSIDSAALPNCTDCLSSCASHCASRVSIPPTFVRSERSVCSTQPKRKPTLAARLGSPPSLKNCDRQASDAPSLQPPPPAAVAGLPRPPRSASSQFPRRLCVPTDSSTDSRALAQSPRLRLGRPRGSGGRRGGLKPRNAPT